MKIRELPNWNDLTPEEQNRLIKIYGEEIPKENGTMMHPLPEDEE